VTQWTHGFDALAERVQQYTPEWVEPITWVSAEKIRAAARLFARTKPALLDWGCAIEHTPKCIQTIRAVSMLPALTGNIDVPGGWMFGMHGLGRFPSLIENLTPEANAKRLGADKFKLLGGEGADLPAAHIPTLLKAMREGKPYPVKAFLVFGNNTLTTYANTSDVYDALMKLDFMVCADLFMTPTAELADIVLPAASWPELDQLVGLPTVAANVVLAQQKAVQIGECKSDEEMFVALARRMKLPCCTEPVKDVLDAMLASGGLNMTFDQLKQKGFHEVPFKYRKYENGGFRTPTGKIELYSTRLAEMGYCRCPITKSRRKARSARPKSPLSIRWCSPPAGGFRTFSIRSTARSKSCARRIAIRWLKSIPQRRRASVSSKGPGCGLRPSAARCAKRPSSPTASTHASSTSSTAGGFPSRRPRTMASGRRTPIC
jgi:anaerobic selenocysteine-containing dehydrogenase